MSVNMIDARDALGGWCRRCATNELIDDVHDLVGVDTNPMIATGQHHESCTGDVVGEIPGVARINHSIGDAVQPPASGPDRRQHVTYVRGRHRLGKRPRRGPRRAAAFHASLPLPERLVLCQRGRVVGDANAAAPPLGDRPNEPVVILRRWRPRVALAAGARGPCPIQHQARYQLRVRGGEQQTHRTRFVDRQQMRR